MCRCSGKLDNFGPKRPILAVLAGVLAASLLLPASALAQSGAGTIQGTVQDATGAAVPNSAIRVVNQRTGVAIDTVSNSGGFYSVPGLFAGSYNLTISAARMKKH